MKKIIIFVFITVPLYGAVKDNIHRYLWANYYQFNNQPAQAQRAYEQLFKESSSPYAYKGYVNLLHRTGSHDAIVKLLPQLDPLFSNDTDMQLIFSQALAHTGNQTAADNRIISLNNSDKSNQEVAFNACQIYIRRKELENALTVIENFLNKSPRRPNNFLFHFLQAQIYVQLHKKEQALSSVKKILEIYPYFDKGWLLLALLEEQENNIDSAVKAYNSFLKVTKEPAGEIKKHVMDLLFKQKLTGPHKTTTTSGQHSAPTTLKLVKQKNRPTADKRSKKTDEKNTFESTLKRWKLTLV